MISSNYLSLWSLFKKEVLRFLKVGIQTIVGPAISSLLFLAVFNLALSRSVQTINGINFANFIAPGLSKVFDFSSTLALMQMKGVPFRTAHEIVGKIVKYAESKNKSLNDSTYLWISV